MGYGDLPGDGVPQTPLDILHMLREESGDDVPMTVGLDDERILQFCDSDPKLVQAIEEARETHFLNHSTLKFLI